MSTQEISAASTNAGPLSESSAPSNQKHTLDELRQDSKLWFKVHVFLYDLRNFRSNHESRDRLDSVVDTYYIGSPYFSATEADYILQTAGNTETTTLKELLDDFFAQRPEKRMQSRMKDTADYRVCAAHDLAPIVEKVFRIHPKDLAKNKGFMKLIRLGGLTALDEGGVWQGIGKR